jgi:hypothetical protein
MGRSNGNYFQLCTLYADVQLLLYENYDTDHSERAAINSKSSVKANPFHYNGPLLNLRDWITYSQVIPLLLIPLLLYSGMTISLAKSLFGKCTHYLIIIMIYNNGCYGGGLKKYSDGIWDLDALSPGLVVDSGTC